MEQGARTDTIGGDMVVRAVTMCADLQQNIFFTQPRNMPKSIYPSIFFCELIKMAQKSHKKC